MNSILSGILSGIIFYSIELRIIRRFCIAKIKCERTLHSIDREDGNKSYYLEVKNESKLDAFNVRVYVEFINDNTQPTYSEKRDFPYVRKHKSGNDSGNVFYTLFSVIPGEKRKKTIEQLFKTNKKLHVVITCQNQFGKIKKTDDFEIGLKDKSVVTLFDF